jgi:DNA processing protein
MNTSEFLFLQSSAGIGDKTIMSISRNMIESGIGSITELSLEQAKAFKGIGKGLNYLGKIIQNNQMAEGIEQEEAYQGALRSKGIEIFTIEQPEYPRLLRALPDPPPIIFVKGNLDLLNNVKSVAVVGTRKNTKRGKLITQKTVQHLVAEGFCIVSGLALGIDSIAHEACLNSGGKTIAVLVDVCKIMPASNLGLSENILASGGLLIAENRPNINAFPALFAKRDRIQAGLSSGVFAIETSINGGTMYAVSAAGNLGRPVYVPDAESAGYEDLTIPQLEGTIHLADSGIAKRYTQKNYTEINEQLEKIYST